MTQLQTDQLFQRAQAALAQGRLSDAEVLARTILEHRRNDTGAFLIMADICGRFGHREDELQWIRRAITCDPKNPRLRGHYGRMLLYSGNLKNALRELETAHKKQPDDHGITADLIATLEGLGRSEAAQRVLKPLIAKRPIAPEIAVVAMRRLVADGDHAAALEIGESSPATGHVRPSVRRNLHFVKAMAYEATGQFDDAFAAAREGNAVGAPQFDPAEFTREIERIVAATPRDVLEAIPPAPEPSDIPVFIVGMPRTGSTLVERMLHAHSAVHGAGECGTVNGLMDPEDQRSFPECLPALTAEMCGTIQDRYLKVLKRMAPTASRIVNKELFNFWYMGLIDRAMPGARIIVCRRDPLDTGISCYLTNLPGETVPFASDLAHIGIVQRGVDRLIEHWRSVIRLPMLDVSYEALVRDPAAHARTLADFVGVPFEEAMTDTAAVRREETTASRDQVRRAIHGEAIGRATRFERHLGPLRDALAGG